MAEIESQLGINRESLVALALMLGCDYCPKGVPGVGRETAIKFVQYMEGESILQRYSSTVFSPDKIYQLNGPFLATFVLAF